MSAHAMRKLDERIRAEPNPRTWARYRVVRNILGLGALVVGVKILKGCRRREK